MRDENGTAGKYALSYTLAPNMFGNASVVIDAPPSCMNLQPLRK